MNTIDAIEQRRSVKSFDPEHVMPKSDFDEIMRLAVLSPTAFNIQNWRFVAVTDKALRQQIREVSWDQAQVTDSSLLVIMCADLNAWDKQPQRYWKNAPQAVQDFLLPAIHDYYKDKDQVKRDEAMRSCGIAAQTLMLSAKAMGYESCPMDGFDFDAVAKLIKLPPQHVISMFVTIGKGTKSALPRGGQVPMDEVVIHNTF